MPLSRTPNASQVERNLQPPEQYSTVGQEGRGMGTSNAAPKKLQIIICASAPEHLPPRNRGTSCAKSATHPGQNGTGMRHTERIQWLHRPAEQKQEGTHAERNSSPGKYQGKKSPPTRNRIPKCPVPWAQVQETLTAGC
jgi:hypothetical protein